jgi:hypothetical protein
MKKLIMISSFLLLAACSKGSKADEFVADYGKLKDKLCACPDKECAVKVKAEADAHERSAKEKGIGKPTEAQEAKFEKIEDEINACADKHGARE